MSFIIISKIHMVLVLLFVISMLIKTVLIFKNTESFDTYRTKTKMPEMIITILFLVLGIVLMAMKDFNFHTLFYVKLGVVFLGIPLGIVGSKKHNKILILLSFLCFFSAYGLSEVAKKKGVQMEITDNVQKSEIGKEIYKVNCLVCHGEDGKFGLNGASDLSTSSLSAADASKVIVEGRNSMPKFAYEGEQLNALTNYLEELKTK